MGLELEFLLGWLWASSFSSIQSLMKSRYDPDGFFAYYALLVTICIVWFSPVFVSILVVHSICLLICFFDNVFYILVSCFFTRFQLRIFSRIGFENVRMWECENARMLCFCYVINDYFIIPPFCLSNAGSDDKANLWIRFRFFGRSYSWNSTVG